MGRIELKTTRRNRRRRGIRKTIVGVPARPRLAVFRSLRHIYAQVIDDLTGRTIAAERARARDISARHGIHGRLVRVFPRNVDAVILGGLNQVIGGTYRGAKTITAAYWKRRGRLVLGAIKVNGRPRAGAVDISAVKRRGCLM